MNKKLKLIVEKLIPARYIELFNSKIIIITKKPDQRHVISDLFLLRQEGEWETYFECIQINKILNPFEVVNKNSIKIFFNDFDGKSIGEKTILLPEDYKISLNIKEIANGLGINKDSTFSIFHTNKTKWLSNFRSYLGDRGYTGYMNLKIGPIKSFVHGNLDALSYFNNKTKLLGNFSFTTKKYFVQHIFESSSKYELFWVNSTNRKQKFNIYEIKSNGKKSISLTANPKGIVKFTKEIDNSGLESKIVVKSKLYLARPLVFKIMKNSFDVFHG